MILDTDVELDESKIESRFNEATELYNKLGADAEKIIENMAATDPEMAVALLCIHENIQIAEYIVKHVDSKGTITRRKDRKTRARNAFITTGLTKSRRREIARRALKTKRSNPSIGVKALRKRKKALRKRKALGL